MDTRHMRYFVALAETLHFGQAAARMNMSQPPFSRQIAAIEKALGVRLFERNSRNVALTAAGKHFLNDCRSVLAGFEVACRDVQLVASGAKGELKLGFTMYAAQNIVPKLARLLSDAAPDVRLVLEERLPTDIDDLLLEERLDAAVTLGNPGMPHLQTMFLARDRLRLIVHTDHPLAKAERVGPQALVAERLIAAPASVVPTLRSAIGAYCAVGGIVPHFGLEPRLQHTIIRLVGEGLGVALIPETLCGDLGETVISRPLVNPPEFDIVLCAPAASKNPAVGRLFDLLGKLSF